MFIHYRVDSETRLEQRSNPFAFLVYGIAIEQSGADAGAPPPRSKSTRACESLQSCSLKPDPDRWICVPGKAGEVMKSQAAGDDLGIVIFQRAINFDGRAAISLAQRTSATIMRVVIDRFHALRNEWRQQLNLLCGCYPRGCRSRK